MARRIVCSVMVLFVAGTFSLMTAPVYANEDRQWTVREAFEAQDIPYYQQSSNICSSHSGPITEAINAGQSGNSQVDDAEGHKIYNFFRAKGAPDFVAAGIVGNLYQESRYNHLLRQNKGTEPNPLKAGARYHPWNPQKPAGGGDAWGITQWDPGVAVLYWQKLAGIQGDITNKQVQLELVWWQLNNIAPTSKKNVLGDMKAVEDTIPVQARERSEARAALAGRAAAVMSARFLAPGIPHLETRMTKAREAVKWPVDPNLVSSFPPATSCTPGSGVSSSVGDGGLTEEQAKTFVMNYGENRNNDTKNVLKDLWYSCNGMGSNCVSFSVFFLKKFTSLSIGRTGHGREVVGYLKGIGVPTGNEPRVGAIFSWSDDGPHGHTGVVLGMQGDTVIVGHASCGSHGRGRGNGTMNSGSAFIRVGNKNDRRVWLGRVPTQFAYPQVDMSAVGSYVGTPTTPVPGGGSVAL